MGIYYKQNIKHEVYFFSIYIYMNPTIPLNYKSLNSAVERLASWMFFPSSKDHR